MHSNPESAPLPLHKHLTISYQRLRRVRFAQAFGLAMACLCGCIAYACFNRMLSQLRPYCLLYSTWIPQPDKKADEWSTHMEEIKHTPAICDAVSYGFMIGSIGAFVCLWFLLLARFTINSFQSRETVTAASFVPPLLLISVTATVGLFVICVIFSSGVDEWCWGVRESFKSESCISLFENHTFISKTSDSAPLPFEISIGSLTVIPVALTFSWLSNLFWLLVALASVYRFSQALDFPQEVRASNGTTSTKDNSTEIFTISRSESRGTRFSLPDLPSHIHNPTEMLPYDKPRTLSP